MAPSSHELRENQQAAGWGYSRAYHRAELFRIGPEDAKKKVYLQAALHADEQPGILVLHHLLQLLRDADAAGDLKAEFVLFPMVNPLGMGDIEFGQHQGRYSRSTGVNHNRGWPVLYDAVGPELAAKLGSDAGENIDLVRAALRDWVESLPQVTALDQWPSLHSATSL